MKLTMFLRSLIFTMLIYYALPVNATSTIIVVGDSLSAGYGLEPSQGWVSLLSDKIKISDLDYLVVNASVTGFTSANGLQQLPQLLTDYSPQIVILALGSNDGLRGNPVFTLKNNLSKMIELAQDKKAQVLLIGFKIPLNYGATYRKQFEDIFPDLSSEYKIKLVPFLLDGFAEDVKYFQSDQLHPNAAAQPIMLDNVWKYLKPML